MRLYVQNTIVKVTALFFLVILFITLINKDIKAQAQMKFILNKIDFGQVQEGKILNHEFVFINAGNQPLIITKIQQGCGCVATSYPVYPVNAGDTASVYTKFVTNGKKGKQNQRIIIFSNADNSPTELRIKCDVKIRN